jgi:hypothetical protein
LDVEAVEGGIQVAERSYAGIKKEIQRSGYAKRSLLTGERLLLAGPQDPCVSTIPFSPAPSETLKGVSLQRAEADLIPETGDRLCPSRNFENAIVDR